MRPRDVRVPLYDMLSAADAIRTFVSNRSYEEYAEDLLLRSAVERQFEILGEAMTRAMRIDPGLGGRLAERQRVVDFRNVIAPGYDTLAHATVWDVAVRYLPELREQIATELREADG